MSGHSKWHTIKHKKGALDAKRGKLFTKLIKEITVAARTGGGDADANARLRKAVLDAKAGNMPNDTIDRAIKRGTGELEGVNYEEITYEGYGPGGAALIIESMTDNRNRTVAEVAAVFGKHVPDFGDCAIAIIRHGFDYQGDAARPVTFVSYFFVVDAFEFACAALYRAPSQSRPRREGWQHAERHD